MAWLADELDNLRTALRWSIEHREVDAGLRLSIAVSAFWHQRGAYAEGRSWFDEILSLSADSAPNATRAMALARAAALAAQQTDLATARRLTDDGLAIARSINDSRGLASLLCVRGAIARTFGYLDQAEAYLEESRFVSRDHGYGEIEFYDLLNLALVALERGDPNAEQLGNASLALAERIGHTRGRAGALYVQGRVAATHGRMAEAGTLLEQALALYRRYMDRDGMETTLRALAQCLLEQGELNPARAMLTESLALAHDGGDRLEMARALEGLVGVMVASDPRRAVRMAAAAAALRQRPGAASYPKDRARLNAWLEVAHRRLSQAACEVAWAQGEALSLEQAVSLGLEDQSRLLRETWNPLSTREQEVALLIASGLSNREIAEELVIAPRTADTHVGNILSKLNLHSRAELAAWAVAHGLTPAAPPAAG